jgi:LysM repeat protein
MTPAEIYAAFVAAANDGRLSGNAPDGLTDLLARLAVQELPVVGGRPGLDSESAWLTGTTTLLNTEWTMRLTGRPIAGADRAALVLELVVVPGPEPWTFAGAFGTLPESRLPAGDGGLLLGPSVVGPLVLESPALVATNEPDTLPRLSGTLPLVGSVLDRYAGYLGDELALDGVVDLADPARPVLVLPAIAPGAGLTLGKLRVDAVGIRLTTAYPDPAFLPDPGAPLSAALLFATATLPTTDQDTITLSAPLLAGDYTWPLDVVFGSPLGLASGIEAVLAIAGLSDDRTRRARFVLPTGIAPIDAFGLSDLSFGVVPVRLGGPAVSSVTIGIASDRTWDPPIPFLTLEGLGTRWQVLFANPPATGLAGVVGVVYGTMRFGQKNVSSLGTDAPYAERVRRGLLSRGGLDDIRVNVQLSLPDLGFTAATAEPFDIPISEAFRAFLGKAVSLQSLTVQSLSIYASYPRKEVDVALDVGGDLTFLAGNVTFSLTGLELGVSVSQSTVSGSLVGLAQIGVPESPPVELFAEAAYPGDGAWQFTAVLYGDLDLTRLVYALMGNDPPDWVKEIQVLLAGLELHYDTGEGNPYSASGTLRFAVCEQLLGIDMKLELTASIRRALRTTPAIETLAVALGGTPLVDPDTVLTGSLAGTFTVGKFEVSASVAVLDKGKDYTFAVRYRDVSLTAATSWVEATGPVPRHQAVTIRLTGTVGDVVTYLVGLANPNANFRLDPPWDFLSSIDLSGLALVVDPTLRTVAVTYDVKLNLGFVTIDSVGLKYDRSGGTARVDFVLLAKMLGDDAAKPVVWDAVNQAPPAVPGKGQRLLDLRYLGLGQHVSPKDLTSYTSISQVVDALVAAMRPVDPAKGKSPIDPAVMAFDASSQWLFGIDAVFMDTVSLKLVMHDPDLYGILVALSGPAAKSLAGLSVELLYKKVTDDIGVFHARLQIPDAFRRLQLGAVSLTLGIITVDIYTNGNFRVDLGFPHDGDWSVSFAVEAGIFNGRGGIYFGVLNGATSNRVPRITNGTFSPVIELGIGLSLGIGRTFEAGPLKAGMYVNLVVVFEGALGWFHPDDGNAGTEVYYWGRGTAGIVGKLYGSVDFKVIAVDISVEISAMATVEFAAYKATIVDLNLSLRASASIKIVFFRVYFSFSLTLRTSFVIGSDSTPPWRVAPGERTPARLGVAALSTGIADVYRLKFDKDAKVFPDGAWRTIRLSLVPAYAVAGVPVNWTGDGVEPPNADPAYRLVMMLVADNAIPVDAVTIADTHRPDVSRNAFAETAADTSFNQLAEGLLRWSLNALGITSPTADVALADLVELVAQLALVEAETYGFTWPNIEGFLLNNAHLLLDATPPAGKVSATPFPMPPPLCWTSPDLPDPAQRDRKFWEQTLVDATYEAEALAYFERLDPRPPSDRPSPQARLAAADEPPESMATFVLRDYVRLVARASAQAAVDLLTSFPHPVDEAHDSLGSIGAAYGVAPEAIAAANPDWPVAAGAKAHLGTLPVRVTAGDTLAGIATTFHADLETWLPELDSTAPLLRAGASVPMGGRTYAGLSVDDTAAMFYVRLGMTLSGDVPLAEWYAAAIARLNDLTGDDLPSPLVVPDGYLKDTTREWTPQPGDTVAYVAAYLALVQNVVPGTPFAAWLAAVRGANDPMTVGSVTLPADATATVLPNDTLELLRERLVLDPAPFRDRVAPADVLVPLVTVNVPDAVLAPTPAGLTLLTLAQAYGLGLEDLAGRIAGDPGVLKTAAKPLRVPDIPSMPLARLAAALHGGEPMATVSGQVARFMLNGLRLPAPVLGDDGRYHATGPMTPGYDLIGVQVTGPAPAPVPPATDVPVVTITVEKGETADWLAFATGTSAVVEITDADLRDNYPATGLAPVVVTPLSALPLSHEVGIRYAVNQVIPWQTTDGPQLPAPPPAAVMPSLWPLPADLMARAAGGVTTSRYLLEQTPGPGAPVTELGSYAWGTLVTFGVRRIPGLPGTVEVLGAGTADRQRLALVLEYLGAVPERPRVADLPPPPPGEAARLRLLWQLPPAPGMTPGLSSVPLAPAATFLAQTNLSTETRSGLATVAGATVGRHFASIADADRFLTLLWECSVVGGGGYWMRLTGAVDAVPDSIYDQDGLATLSLLIQLDSQSTAPADRRLYAFDNVAVVGDGIDPASVALTARATDPPELRPVASVDPGQVGYYAEYANPDFDDSPEGLLRRLYGLLGFRLAPTVWFDGSTDGRPVSPRPPDSRDELGLLVADEADETTWRIARVVDAGRFARVHLPPVPTAPPPEGDPYAGIAAGAETSAEVWFQDVFGNVSGTPGLLPIPVRYTDPLTGVGAWPSTTARYTLAPAGAQADVVVSVDLQTVAYQPAAGDPGTVATAAAARDRDRLAAAYYQVAQPDVHAAVLTSLQQAPGAEPAPLPVDMDALRRYVLAAHLLLGTVAALGDAHPIPAPVDDVVRDHGLDCDTLAAANAGAVLAALLGAATLDVPVGAVFRTGDTVAGLCPAGVDAATVLQDEDNVVLPLTPGVELTTPARDVTVPAADARTGAPPTATEVAALARCTLATLVTANETRTGLLTPGFVFDCNGVQVTVAPEPPGSETTLALVTKAFRDLGVTTYGTEQIVAMNAETPGMFRAGASLVADGYVVANGDTLRRNELHLTPAALAPLNTATVDLFPPGTPLFLTTTPTGVPAGETLAAFAAAHGTTPGALLRHNGTIPVTAAAVLPGTWSWPAGAGALRVPYTTGTGDSLDGLAPHFTGATARSLVADNADMPGTVAAGVDVTVGTEHARTAAPSSFAEVCALFDPAVPLDALADAIAARTDVLADGALLACPPAVLPAAPAGPAGVTPVDAAKPFGVSAVALLAANAGTPGILLPGQTLAAWPPVAGSPAPPTVTTARYDTLTAVVERFRGDGVSTSIETVVTANAGLGFLSPGATVLVPPATVKLRARIGTAGGEWTFPSPVFPVEVRLEIARDADLVDPALAATATRTRTNVAAARDTDDGQEGARTLAAFAEAVQAAVPVLRIATGQVLGADTDVWAVRFGDGGIANVRVYPPLTVEDSAQPRAFAIRPLANTLIARRGITTQTFEVATGKLDPDKSETRDYQGIDLDVWARGLLADVELVLSAAYVRGAYALNPPALDGILEAKKTLAGAVARGLDYVLDGERPQGPDPKREAAIETLRQQLLVSLSRGYDTSAVIQYDTTVASPWPGTYARLSGSPVVTFDDPDAPHTATVSNGKVSLADGDSQVSLLVNVPDVGAQAKLLATLDLRILELEFGVTPEIDGYERSDWLTFVTPIGDGTPPALQLDLGSPRVPLPLRAYPPMPLLVDHSAAAADPDPQVLADALYWRYAFALAHQSAEQDSVEFRVTFNVDDSVKTQVLGGDDLFSALAQYTSVATPLLGLLATVVDWEKASGDQQRVLGNALGTFRDLVTAAGVAWSKHWPPPIPAGPDALTLGTGPVLDVYDYALGLHAVGDSYATLKLARTVVSEGPGTGKVGWPDIVCITPAGKEYPLAPAAAETCDCTDPERCHCYLFPAGKVAAYTYLTFRFTFPKVHVASYQNATSSTWVTRNAKLLGDTWPDTTPDFVYRTPSVSYPAPAVPFIDVTRSLAIGPWPAGPLTEMFDAVFDGDDADRTIALGVRYGYTLVPGDPPVEALLPVVQSTVGPYGADTISKVTERINEWKAVTEPATDGGAWAFWISLYSSLDPTLQRPVLQLKRLSSALVAPGDG